MPGNAAIVRRSYEAVNRGDVETLTELLGDNVSWHTPGRSPLAGDVVGREAVFARLGRYLAETGALSFVGLANVNVARMVVHDLNAAGGLLGRPLELHIEDSATDDGVAAAKARKLVEVDQVDIVLGGIYSSTRQAIKGPVVVE